MPSSWRRLERFKTEVEGTVRVASIYSVGLSEMSRLEEEFSRRYPHARLEVDYLRPEKVYEAVVTDQADLGLMSYPESTKEVTVLPWREEEMVVAAFPDHPLGEQGRSAARKIWKGWTSSALTKNCPSAATSIVFCASITSTST